MDYLYFFRKSITKNRLFSDRLFVLLTQAPLLREALLSLRLKRLWRLLTHNLFVAKGSKRKREIGYPIESGMIDNICHPALNAGFTPIATNYALYTWVWMPHPSISQG